MNQAQLGLLMAGVVNVGYAISRGISKQNGENSKPGYKTSEFWLTVLGNILAVAQQIFGKPV